MIRWSVLFASALVLGLSAFGCLPASTSSSDEQKDPHYLHGRTLVSSMDYKGAIEEFEKALHANPRSAAAHFELAWLHQEHMKDYAAAIYHYQQHLKFRPNSEYAERAKEQIRACKMDLVKSELLGPVNQGIQRDMDRLTNDNLLLKRQVETLQAQIAAQQASLATATRVTPPPIAAPPHASAQGTQVSGRETQTPSRPRNHTVKSGDTVTAIAKDYGVPVNSLLKANPSVDPRRLKVGQVLKVPAS